MTLAFGEIVRIVSINWTEFTGGAVGIRNIPPLNFVDGGMVAPTTTYYIILTVVVILVVALASLIASPVGRAWVAIREDELVASSIGSERDGTSFWPTWLGPRYWVIGAFFAHMNQFVNPDSFTLEDNFIVLSLVILGGAGTLWGPITGAVLWIFFQAVAKDIPLIQAHPEFRTGLLALIVVVLMILRPGGIVSKRLELTRARGGRLPWGIWSRQADLTGVVSHSGRQVREMKQVFGGLTALELVTFDSAARRSVGLMGPNGAGKSTLLNAISGVTRATSGTVELYGERTEKLESSAVSTRGIARTFQAEALLGHDGSRKPPGWWTRTARRIRAEFLSPFPFVRRSERFTVEEAEEALAFVDAWECRDRRASSLDAYQQRKVEIARALMTRPKVLLLDEPAAGLNESETRDLSTLIARIRSMESTSS